MLKWNMRENDCLEIYSVNNNSQLNLYFSTTLLSCTPKKRSTTQPKPFYGWVMIDSGASSCFINKSLIDKFQLQIRKKKMLCKLKVIDRCEISSRLVEDECSFKMRIGNHTENIDCNVINIG
jgi:hypothetical protein